MSLDLKRVRDDAHELTTTNKKRVTQTQMSIKLETSNGTNGNGVSVGEEDEPVEEWIKHVETKRKQAIYRQMQEYRRQAHRHSLRIHALEQEREHCQAEVMSVDVCWKELVAAVQDMAGFDSDPQCLEQIPPSVPALQEFTKALQRRSEATRSLIDRVLKLPVGSASTPRPCFDPEQHAQATQLLQAQLRDVQLEREQVERDLRKAEKTVDRLRMEAALSASSPAAAAAEGSKIEHGHSRSGTTTPNAMAPSAHSKGEVTEEKEEKAMGDMLGDTTELQLLADRRAQEIQSLREEQTRIIRENDQLRLQATHPLDQQTLSSPFFAAYKLQLAEMNARATAAESTAAELNNTVSDLRLNNLQFRDAVSAEARAQVDALRTQCGKKDVDLARLRGQRDDFQAELFERRAREADKGRWGDEVQTLAQSRAERIGVLQSEVKRLKARMAAREGEGGLYAFLAGVEDGDIGFVRDLEAKIAAAKERESALEAQLTSYATSSSSSSSADIVESERKTRLELHQAKKALEGYERVLGPDAAAPMDVQALARRLEELEAARRKLELQVKEADDSTNALYTELEQLSKAWESLDHQNNSKVFDLREAELKVSRLTTEKAKSDNKYFAAMRAKDMVDLEAKALVVKVEKQMRLLEKAGEMEKHLNGQVAAQTAQSVQVRSTAEGLQHSLARCAAEKKQLEISLLHGQTLLAEAKNALGQRVAEANAERAARFKLEEELESSKRSVVKLNERQETMVATSASVGEVKLQEERDKLLKILRCSCCEHNFKQQVITKCMHNCLDKRVASRQRKCPACGGAFSKEDIGTLYWQ